MVLSTRNGKKKFKIYEQNTHFLMGVLSHDIKNNCTQYLQPGHILNIRACSDVSASISKALTLHKVYEVWDGVQIEPVFDPTKDMISNFSHNIQPLTDKRRNFLLSLNKFLNSSNEIHIT